MTSLDGNIPSIVAVGTEYFNGGIMMALRGDADNTPLQIKLDALAELIAKLGILYTALLIQLGKGKPIRTSRQKSTAFVNILIISVALIIIPVPEGLPLAVTLALAFATKRMSFEKLLVRILGSCETMANASVVCIDKTGTLTQNVMTVVAGSVGIHAKFVRHLENNEARTNVDEPGVRKHLNDFSLDQSQLNTALSPQLRELFNEAIAVNSTAFQDTSPEGEPIFVGSKTETALLQFAQELKWPDFRTTRDTATVVQIIPFSSERKATGVIVKTRQGKFRLFLKGASEILSKKCVAHVVVHKDGKSAGSASGGIETAAIDELANDNITRTTIFYANQMLRTIALCYRDFKSWPPRNTAHDEQNEVSYDDLAQDLTLIGIVGIEDPLRPGVLEAVKQCQMAGVTIKMCTGDNVLTARSIATQCGIFSPGGVIMEGPVFRDLSPAEKIEIVPRLQVLARSSPEDKRVLVETLKQIGEIVGVTSDGTSDGPALKTANVGFSMGVAGTETAKEASDIILMEDNFASIVKAIMWGRCMNDAVRKFSQFQVSTIVTAVVITFVSAIASGQQSSVLSAVQLLWINIIINTFAALALATDPATESLLNRKPDKKTVPLFSVDMYKQILFQSTYQIIITLVFHFAGLQILGLGHSQNNDLIVQTLVFNAFVFAQIFNSVNCRRLDRHLNIFEGITKNWYFIIITLIEIGGQIMIVFIGGAAFGVTPIGGRDWGISLALGVVSIPLGAFIRLLPNDPFEKLFKRLGLLGSPDVLPTTPNLDTVGWNAITRVRDNLATFANVRGGRVRSSSFVVKSRTARLNQEKERPVSLLAMAPTLVVGTIADSPAWTQLGSLSDQHYPLGHYPDTRTLLQQLRSIYHEYKDGDPFAIYHDICDGSRERQVRLTRIFNRYGVPVIEPPNIQIAATKRKRSNICAREMARIKRILRDCQRLGPDIDFNQIVLFRDHVQQVEGLMESCKRLEYLLRGGVSSQTQRDTIENLLKTIKMSPVLDDIGLQILRGLEGFTELYFRFCESALMGEDTETTILELRELVKGELDRANERIKDFNALSKHYAEKRHDLTVLMQESTKSAEKDGFREGVSSDVESQQIYDELGKIDKLIKQIGETLKHTKDFWKDVDQSLRSASSVRANQQAKDPPDGITSGPGELGLERRAEKIQTGLNTVCQAAQQYCSSKKMLKTGNDLVEDAACLTTKCTAIVRVQTSVVSQLHTQSFDLKSTRKSIPPLTKALRSAVKGYQKLSLQFEKYAQKIYLLFWFAGTTAEEKLGVERSAHWEFAREYLQSKELSPCVLSFESAFYGIERQLRETQSFWMTVGGWTSTL